MKANYHTQWAEAFAIAAELSRRRYTVAFTLSNAPPPAFDLVCVAPSGCAFKVEAKGTSGRSFIRTRKAILEMPLREDLFLIVALLPTGPSSAFRFFIMTHEEIRHVWQETPSQMASGKPYVLGHEGLKWKVVAQHENEWSKLPGKHCYESLSQSNRQMLQLLTRVLANGRTNKRSPSADL